MIDERLFSGGLLKLAAAVRQPLTDADFEAYDVLRELGTTDEWNGYVTWCLRTGEWPERWPKLEELRESFARWTRERRPQPKQLQASNEPEFEPLPEEPAARQQEIRRRFEAGRAAFNAELQQRGIDLKLRRVIWPEEREEHAAKVREQAREAMASVPFMITRQMTEDLRAMGCSDEEIASMTPDEAWKRLGGELAPQIAEEVRSDADI